MPYCMYTYYCCKYVAFTIMHMHTCFKEFHADSIFSTAGRLNKSRDGSMKKPPRDFSKSSFWLCVQAFSRRNRVQTFFSRAVCPCVLPCHGNCCHSSRRAIYWLSILHVISIFFSTLKALFRVGETCSLGYHCRR